MVGEGVSCWLPLPQKAKTALELREYLCMRQETQELEAAEATVSLKKYLLQKCDKLLMLRLGK